MVGLRGAPQIQWWLGVVLMFLPLGWSCAAISLEFERRHYGVDPTDGGEMEVRVMIDGDAAAPGRQPVPNGLFSYGFRMRFDGARLRPAPQNAIVMEPALDFFGFTAGAEVSTGHGFFAVRGNIDPLGPPWTGNLLATIRLRFIGPPPTSTPLALEILQQAPNESVFVNGLGVQIDQQIVARSGVIVLLQPPSVQWVAALQPHARLTFTVPQGADVVVQWSRSMAQGDWHDFPGAPHNSGQYLDFSPADRRFYRLTLRER